MNKKNIFLILVYFLFFTACDISYRNQASHQTKFLRYVGHSKYKQLSTNVFFINERVFFDVPVFDFIIADELGYYNFEYKIEVLDKNNKSIFAFEQKLLSKKISEFPSSEYLRFYFDSTKKNKAGQYLFRVKVMDLNIRYENTWEDKFTLKRR